MKQILLTLGLILFTVVGCSDEKARVCATLGEQHVSRMKSEYKQDYANIKTDNLYSPTIDACVHTEVAIVGVRFEIVDLSKGLLIANYVSLLNCDQSGADSVIVDAVKRRGGLMSNVPYSEWLDDGFGGPPRTLKTPSQPYGVEQCQRVFDKWMAFLTKRTG